MLPSRLLVASFKCSPTLPSAKPRPFSERGPRPPPSDRLRGRRAADYRDVVGKLVHQVCRYEDETGNKTFRQRWPDGNGGWLYKKPEGFQHVPYRLPELLDHDRTIPILIVEGEKDVDNLAAIGVTATTNAGGAGNWRPELNEHLAGREVILVPDNDDVGRDHMQKVARGLYDVASRVRIFDLGQRWKKCPAKGDLSDWLAVSAKPKEEKQRILIEAVERFSEAWLPPPDPIDRDEAAQENLDNQTVEEKSSAPEALRLWFHGDPIPEELERKFRIAGMLPEVGYGKISGQWGTYKTFIALDLAFCLMTGVAFAGHEVKGRCGVLFIAAEGAFEVPARLQGICRTQALDGALPFAMTDECPPLLQKGAFEELKAIATAAAERIRREHGLELGAIIIDTLSAAAGFVDENSNSEVQRAVNILIALSRAMNCSVLDIDHHGKAVETGTRGASAKDASADMVLAVLGDKDEAGKITNTRLAIRKVRGARTGSEIPFGVEVVDLGSEGRGDRTDTLVIRWGTEGAPTYTIGSGRWPKKLRAFEDALHEVLIDTESFVTINGTALKAADREVVKREYFRRWSGEGDTKEQRHENRKRAFNRAVKDAQELRLIGIQSTDERTLMWLTSAETKTPTGVSNEPFDRDSSDSP